MNNDVHFGRLLKELIEKQDGSTSAAYGKLGYKNQEALYPVLKKEDVNTSLLKKVCSVYGIELSYFLENQDTGKGNGKAFSSGRAANNNDEKESSEKRVAVLEAEKKGLEEQLKLLREMVDMYKSRDK